MTGITGFPIASELLFERLPERIFGPLASANRQRYWTLLCSLHERRFGPDAPLPPSNGFLTRDITLDIEVSLLLQDSWILESGESPETPIGIRAAGVFSHFVETGWLHLTRHGVERRVVMKPVVSQFLTRLIAFAETGPVFVAGKVRSIDANLHLIISGEGSGDSLLEAAEQARNLLEHVRITGTNIRDLMDSFDIDVSTAYYVRRFFSEYVERVFIADYRELRTREHPLSRRPQILRRVEELHASTDQRMRLIGWYEAKRCPGDPRKAERLFERDIQRLFDLQRIDEYLDRLDDEIRRANKRALAFLDFRLRSLRPVDHLVTFAIKRICADPTTTCAAPFPPGDLVGPDRLAEPRVNTERSAPTALRKEPPSLEQIARSRLMLRARDARTVTPVKLVEFLRRQLDGRCEIANQDIGLKTVADVRAYQALVPIAIAMSSNNSTLGLAAKATARGFDIYIDGTDELPGTHISSLPFRIELRTRKSRTGGEHT